jgi:GDP-L-fucose synthase
MTGPLEESNAPYSLAKLAGIKLTQSYRAEYGHDWISILPTNLYGPYDNFNLEDSHVLPSLMRKFQLAIQENRKTVEIWGDGTPSREFLHVRDLASAIRIAADKYSSEIPMNIGSQAEYTIREIVEILRSVSNFRGEVLYDPTKPNGAHRKQLDSTKILNLGWKPSIMLEQGLKETYEWLNQSLANGEKIKL